MSSKPKKLFNFPSISSEECQQEYDMWTKDLTFSFQLCLILTVWHLIVRSLPKGDCQSSVVINEKSIPMMRSAGMAVSLKRSCRISPENVKALR
jgi:hypothetical protein